MWTETKLRENKWLYSKCGSIVLEVCTGKSKTSHCQYQLLYVNKTQFISMMKCCATDGCIQTQCTLSLLG